MAYPMMNDYNTAIQNPNITIKDPELKTCKAEVALFGLPRVASGGFALTYKLGKGGKYWAVRCFHKEVPDLQDRYAKISSFLKSSRSDYFVEFNYIKEGILVNGKYYPIVKMEWLDGIPLNFYIEKNLNNPSALDKISSDLIMCTSEMEQLGIAHGDLQHGNIIIENGKLKLIDYDGFYVPGMNYSRSNEIGHVNYQHPLRDEKHVGSYIDRFSAIVIYVAIQALKVMPSLWSKYDYGENILFKRDDFINCHNSPLINQLKSINALNKLVESFIKICSVKVDSVPKLEDFIKGNFHFDASQLVEFTQAKSIRRRQYKVIDANNKLELLRHVGDVVEVVGQIDNVYSSFTQTKNPKPYNMLNFGKYKNKCFRIPVWSDSYKILVKHGININTYEGKWASVIGLISVYDNFPQIVFDSSTRINILRDAFEAESILKETSYAVFDTNDKPRVNNSEILRKIGVKDNNTSGRVASNVRTSTSLNTARSTQNNQKPISKNQAILNQINQKSGSTNAASNSSYSSNSSYKPSSNRQTYIPKSTSTRKQPSTYKSNPNCFIATEVYGNNDAPEVHILRNWRDLYLSKYEIGKKFISFYYKNSPQFVKWLKDKYAVKKIIKILLDTFVRMIQKKESRW